MAGEILVMPFYGQGHLFPCIELCNHFISRAFNATLLISSTLSSSIPDSLRKNPKIQILEILSGGQSHHPPSPGHDIMSVFDDRHRKMGLEIEKLLTERSPKPVCAVIDTMMSQTREVFWNLGIPTVTFFTSGASSPAVDLCAWKAGVKESEIKPGEIRILPGLPEEFGLSYSEIRRRPGPPGFGPGPAGGGGPSILDHGPPILEGTLSILDHGPPYLGGCPSILDHGGGPSILHPGPPNLGGSPGHGLPPSGHDKPPELGEKPRWMEEIQGSVGLMVNTCDELEGQFLRYLSGNLEVPVWGVGPLLPANYWNSSGKLVNDRNLRATRNSSHSEEEVAAWLDSKPQGSVLYVSFGSEVGPSNLEFAQLAEALAESNRSFIWALNPNVVAHGPPGASNAQEGYFPHDLSDKVGNRGLIIKGWAPQLMILSHPSTGGFLSHCGWNSTVEALGRGVPILAWPIRGDQFSDAKLVVCLLKIGYMISDDFSKSVDKEQIGRGIELLLCDMEMKKRAVAIAAQFGSAFPPSSVAALDAFSDFISTLET